MHIRIHGIALLIGTISLSLAWAQAPAGSAAAPDHAQHQLKEATPSPAIKKDMNNSMQGMDHGNMNMQSSPAPAPKDAMQGMDHGEMNAQGGPPPADARDPHGYSGGFTLDKGPYASPKTPRLKLADEHSFTTMLINRFERSYDRDDNAAVYDGQAWFGTAYDRLVIKAEGDAAKGKLQEARTELLWGHAIASFWDAQVGLRHDSGTGPERTWLAFGVQGLAPYWFEVDATAYVGENGRTALRLDGEYELLLTQKLILQPRAEINYYGKSDLGREIGSGFSDGVIGLRLRYEINRQFAPYIGVEHTSKFGKTADLAHADGARTGETRWVAGVRVWF